MYAAGRFGSGCATSSFTAWTRSGRRRRTSIHGDKYRTELAASFSHQWKLAPYLEGAWHSMPGGPDAPAYAPLNQVQGKVHFASDYLSYLDAWQHGAISSARKVVTEQHQCVLAC